MSDAMISDAISALRLLALRIMIDAGGGEGEEFYVYFRTFEKQGFSREVARAICRDLRDEGLAIYGRGLMSEDGDMCGAGYAITAKGRAYYADSGMEVEV